MPDTTIAARLIDSLYAETGALTDESRRYFEQRANVEQQLGTAAERLALACEALRATTRLMQVAGWLLTRKLVRPEEFAPEGAPASHHGLGAAPHFDHAQVATFPPEAQRLLAASADLYDRVRRLDSESVAAEPIDSPARSLLRRIERAL